MRLKLRAVAGLIILSALAAGAIAAPQSGAAQRDDTLLPEQSAAKSKAILQQVIAALGGPSFLNVRDSDCTGRLAQFGHSGDLMGYAEFRDLWLLPDKNRIEYDKLGNIVDLYSGDEGWTLDRSGVSDEPEDAVKSFDEQVKSNMDNVLRSRLNEEGMEFLYAGTDLIDMKEADWVEISDRDHREFRIAVDRLSHLPLRWVVVTRDPQTRERTENITTYARFIDIDGVQIPLNVSREQNGRQIFQVFYTSCTYNSNLSPELFTRASLEQRYAQVGKKGYKDSKDKNGK